MSESKGNAADSIFNNPLLSFFLTRYNGLPIFAENVILPTDDRFSRGSHEF